MDHKYLTENSNAWKYIYVELHIILKLIILWIMQNYNHFSILCRLGVTKICHGVGTEAAHLGCYLWFIGVQGGIKLTFYSYYSI